MGLEQKISPEPTAIGGSATGEFDMRRRIRRRRSRSFMDLVPPGARGMPLTNALLREQASVTHIDYVKAEKAMTTSEAWVSEAAGRAVAANGAGETRGDNEAGTAKELKEKEKTA
jgi:hypothetical protein